MTWLPNENWQLSANFTDLPVAKYLEYPGVPQQIGMRFGSAPRQAVNLTAKYTFKEGPLQGFSLGGWLHAQTSTSGVLGGDWHYDVHLPGLTQVSAFASYKWNRLDFRFNIDNLTDRRGYVMNNAFHRFAISAPKRCACATVPRRATANAPSSPARCSFPRARLRRAAGPCFRTRTAPPA